MIVDGSMAVVAVAAVVGGAAGRLVGVGAAPSMAAKNVLSSAGSVANAPVPLPASTPWVGRVRKLTLPPGQVSHLRGEAEQVEPGVKGQGAAGGVGEAAELAGGGEGPCGKHFAGRPGQEGLLPADPVQVTLGQSVSLPDEGHRGAAGNLLGAGFEVGAGVGIVDWGVEAYRHPADRVGQGVEADQVDLGVVVDAQPGEGLDDGLQFGAAGVVGVHFYLRRGHTAFPPVPRLGVKLRGAVEGVDLVRLVGSLGAVVVGPFHHVRHRRRDPGISWQRDPGRLSAALRNVHHHDGVGDDAASVGLSAHRRQFRGGKRVALLIGASVGADQQNVAPAAEQHAGGSGVGGAGTGGDFLAGIRGGDRGERAHREHQDRHQRRRAPTEDQRNSRPPGPVPRPTAASELGRRRIGGRWTPVGRVRGHG